MTGRVSSGPRSRGNSTNSSDESTELPNAMTAKPFTPCNAYWAGRMGRYPGMRPWVARCIRRQGGRCSECGLFFRPGDLVEVHHRDRDHDNYHTKNLAAMHRHCHDGVHRGKEVITEGSIHDKDGSAEEPYECESLTYGFEDQPGG